MLKHLKSLFVVVAEDNEEQRERRLHLAAALLLFEVVKADHAVEPEEEKQLQKVLRDYWHFDEETLQELIEAAEKQSVSNTSLYDQVSIINESFSQQDKYDLLRGLWSVALADQEVHQYEEHLIRRLADMLHLSHSQFIKAKCEVLDSL